MKQRRTEKKAAAAGKGPTGLQSARRLAHAAYEKNATDLVLLDVRGIATFADYFLICSGRSDRQAQAIADGILEELKKLKKGRGRAGRPSGIALGGAHGVALGIEGYEQGRWILLDCDDIICHIFYEKTRLFYNLERLWHEARRLKTAPPRRVKGKRTGGRREKAR